MIFYVFDFLVNNIGIFVCGTILFKLGNYKYRDLLFLLFIDIFINRIPIIFFSILVLNFINKWVRKRLVNSYLLDNLLFLANYLLFFAIIFWFRNKNWIIDELLEFYWHTFWINYILFLLIYNTNDRVLKNK